MFALFPSPCPPVTKPSQAVSTPAPIPEASYYGEFQHAVDAKKRLVIPSPWRSGGEQEESFHLMPSPNLPCLLVMPPAEVLRIQREAEAALSPRDRQTFQRQFGARLRTLPSDRQGRLTLTDDQCRHASLADQAILIGTCRRFEIWSPENWRSHHTAETQSYQLAAATLGL
jgi:MraZ protein